MSTTTMTPAARREAWLAELFAPVHAFIDQAGENPPADSVLWTNLLDRVATEGPSRGRSQAWRDAVAWHAARLAEGMKADWVALQGNVWLTYAA